MCVIKIRTNINQSLVSNDVIVLSYDIAIQFHNNNNNNIPNEIL